MKKAKKDMKKLRIQKIRQIQRKTVKSAQIKTKFSNGVTIDRRLININAKTRNEFANSDYTNKIKYKKSVAPKDFKNDVFRSDTFY